MVMHLLIEEKRRRIAPIVAGVVALVFASWIGAYVWQGQGTNAMAFDAALAGLQSGKLHPEHEAVVIRRVRLGAEHAIEALRCSKSPHAAAALEVLRQAVGR